MSAVYTKRLMSVNLAAGAQASAVVPAGKTWVIRNCVAICDTVGSQMLLGLYAPYPVTVGIALVPPNQTQVFNLETRIVLLPGEELRAIAVQQGPWHVTITGYEFIL
jgi:hypothetical protein